MGQSSFHNFKATLLSNDMNRWLLGIFEPSRYRGYDQMNVTGLNFTLAHTVTGIKQTKEDLTQTAETGIVLTKQGYVIQEDAAISGLSCSTNASNAFTRIDLVVLTHQDVNTIGGSPATYSVVTGANGGPVEPALPNPNYQIIIGTISIPANASDLSGATYTPSKAPLLGGQVFNDTNFPWLKFYALLGGSPNNFTKTQRWGKSGVPLVIDLNNKIVFQTEGNLFSFNGTGTQTVDEMDSQGGVTGDGTVIFITNNTAFDLIFTLNATPNGGGIPFSHPGMHEGLGIPLNYVLKGGKNDIMMLIQDNGFWKIISTPYDLYAVVKNITDNTTTLSNTVSTLSSLVSSQNPNNLITKVVNIGTWNMDSAATFSVAHGITDSLKIRGWEVIIVSNAGTQYKLEGQMLVDGTEVKGGTAYVVGPNVVLEREASGNNGVFDQPGFDFGGGSGIRGYIIIKYIP